MKGEIVRFENGKYGIRYKRFLFPIYAYRDLNTPQFTWSRANKFFPECQGSLQRVWNIFNSDDHLVTVVPLEEIPRLLEKEEGEE